ncbi:50S ribosomal protein L9 [Ornithinimicrobium pratense]|uniref:Large ribosomal subunit protein bL9 n=1 Tax=Ornithinimicrobium pratense TaxID=2593973 RepID=A0A5J6VAA1_9MICO|nr:50S ribosomal protein L9 [Ornithinimicrobium pratense]QFG70012.1 50S ribosomal protein L9 [Ornithinimicrobium pratense]
MKIILTQPVTGLGEAGDVVDVKDGYARNFLLPRQVATPWTKGGQKQVDSIKAGREKRALRTAEEAATAKATLESTTVTVTARAGQGGRLFGAVTPSEIAEAIAASGGPQVDKRRIEVRSPIRAVGEHPVHVRLHDEVAVDVTINVVAS